MELKFQKRSLKILRRAAGEVQNQEQTLEVRLSDGMPDIGRVLASWGQVILRGKEWRRGSISCSGGVQAWTLYAPEDGSDVRCVESWLPFQMNWTMPEEEQDGDIRIQCLLRFVDARSVSARKLMLRAGIAAFGEGYVPEEREVSVPGEVPEDVQLLKSSYPVRLYKEAGERAFNLDEDLTMPGSSPVPSKLIYCTMQPEITERRVSGNRVAFRGNGNLHLLYRSQEGQLHGWDFELPFSMLGELKQTYGADAQAQVDMAVTDLELVLDGEGHFRLKCGLLGQYLVSDREMIEIVEDAYSTGRPLEPEWETLELPSILDSRMENLYAEQSIPQDADITVDTAFLPDFPRQRRNADAVELEVPGQFQTLWYGEDGRLQAGTARWEGSRKLNADEDTTIQTQVIPMGRPQAISGSGNLTMKAEVGLQTTTQSQRGIPMVTGLELAGEPAADPARPSLILRRTGTDRLWDIAKSTGSTMEAIRQANGITDQPKPDQILLIPVS